MGVKDLKIGDRVIALNTRTGEEYQNRIQGHVYPVLDIIYCTKCGSMALNITEPRPIDFTLCHCGHVSKSNGRAYTHPMHFVKADGDLTERIEEAEKEENYELAGFLSSIKKEEEEHAKD